MVAKTQTNLLVHLRHSKAVFNAMIAPVAAAHMVVSQNLCRD